MTEKVSEVGEAADSDFIPQEEEKVERDPVAALTEDLQRLQAEYSNYKKRVDRDRLLAGEIATAATLIEFLPILDDLDRASEHGELSGGFKAIADQVLNATVAEWPNASDCKSLKPLVQIQPVAPIKEVWQSLADCTCLENRRVERHREFESHRFRQYRG